jgi:hypothetical protein
MNCSEFQNISHELARDRVEGRDRIEALAHAGECPRCAEYLEDERRLTLKLGFLSQALHSQEAPATLESALVTAFREHAAHTGGGGSVPVHAGPRFWAHQKFWGWATTAAALAAVIALAVGIHSRRSSQSETPEASVSTSATQMHESAPTTAANSQQDDNQPQATIHTVRHRRSPRVRSGDAPLMTVSDNSGFVPLMYCDQLNCGTPGEIVRVEIPASSLPMMGLVSDNHTGPVRADVVVGEDGIARAIRLVDY